MTRNQTERTGTQPMPLTSSTPLLALCMVAAVLAAVAAAVGFFSTGGVGPFTATSVRGDAVEMYGRGVYEYDSLFRAAGQRGADAVTLLVAIPLLAVSAWYYRRGSMRALLTLTGALVVLTYVGISYLGAVAYNPLFLVYVALFSSSLFALILAFAAIGRDELGRRIDDRMPHKATAVFLFVSGAATTVIWLMTPIEGVLAGEPPGKLEVYTSLFTHGLDIALIVPSLIVAGFLVRRRDPLGYAIAIPLIVFASYLAPMITAMTVVQLQEGVEFAVAEIVGPIAGFALLAAVAIWLLVRVLRHIADSLSEVAEPHRLARLRPRPSGRSGGRLGKAGHQLGHPRSGS